VAAYLGVQHDGQLAHLDCHHVFSAPKHSHDIVGDAKEDLKRRRKKRQVSAEKHVLDGILYDQKQVLRQRLFKRAVPAPLDGWVKRADKSAVSAAAKERSAMASALQISDPIFNDQWHLYNVDETGHDLNISGVWSQGITGKNATVCIIDDGLDMDSEDLKPNYYAPGSWDFNDKVPDPKPRLDDDTHGTRCAGEVAAAKNRACGVGVAWDANIAGIRILSGPITDIDEADAVMYHYQQNDIYSCSWGPPDNGQVMDAPGIMIKRAMLSAVQKGRQGKGSIYVFAAGNGAPHHDNCNFDGYTNSIYSVTVGAIDREDKHPWYSESCSALMVVTYSSGGPGKAISTTDIGRNECTSGHGGTSAAGPLASGVYALVLQERPDLTWRDIQWLTVLTSTKPVAEESDWQVGPLGRPYSHTFGYGKLDAYNIVEMAKTWQNVKPQAWYYSPWFHVRHAIPQGEKGLVSTFVVTEEMLQAANLERLEHVTVTTNINHTRRGDLSVELRSPAGIVSHLKERDVLFIDEIHRLSPVVEENLYPAMEDFKFDLVLGQGPQA
ncbi:MAG: S8 family serine peptidase, partial [Terriglobus roseus]|nr:S8 family serine peptidase [Terriglobus roseus]